MFAPSLPREHTEGSLSTIQVSLDIARRSAFAQMAPEDRNPLIQQVHVECMSDSPGFIVVNMPLLETTPETTTVTPQALSFSKLQQWFTFGLALAVYHVVSGVYHILLGNLNLIQMLSAFFSWLLLISAVCQIVSGVRSLLRGFKKCQHWIEAEDQLHYDHTVNLTSLSYPKLRQCAQLILTACTIGLGVFDLVKLFSSGFGWVLLISAVFHIGSGVFDLVPESQRLLILR